MENEFRKLLGEVDDMDEFVLFQTTEPRRRCAGDLGCVVQ